MNEKPKMPEIRMTCSYCGTTLPKSEYVAHFCAKHPKLGVAP